MPEAPRCQPDVPGDFGQAPSACGVDPRSQVTRARFTWPCEVDWLSRGNRALAHGPAGSTSCPGTLALGAEVPRDRQTVPVDSGSAPMPVGSQLSGPPVLESEGPRVRPAVPGDSGPFRRNCVVDQLSRETRDLVGGPAVTTSLPGHLRLLPDGPAMSTSCPGGLGPCPKDRVSNSFPGRLALGSEEPWGQPAVPGISGPGRVIAASITRPGR